MTTVGEMRDFLREKLEEWGFECEPIERARQLLDGLLDNDELDEETVRKINDWFARTGEHGAVEHRLCGPWCPHYEPDGPMCPYTTTETETDRPIRVRLDHVLARPSCGRAWYAVSRRLVDAPPGVTVEEEREGVWVYEHDQTKG